MTKNLSANQKNNFCIDYSKPMKRCRRIGKAVRLYAVFHRDWDDNRDADRRKCGSGGFGRSFPVVGISSFLSLTLQKIANIPFDI